MKKVVLSLAVLFSVALVSCGNKAAEATDSESVQVEETVAVTEESATVVEESAAVAPEAAPATDAPAADSAK